jgi:membrane protein involved in colicin uptake
MPDEPIAPEQHRQTAEGAREKAEDGRQSAEEDRRLTEEHRNSAESLRSAGEQFRRLAEEARSVSEDARHAAESARREADAARDATIDAVSCHGRHALEAQRRMKVVEEMRRTSAPFATRTSPARIDGRFTTTQRGRCALRHMC